MLLNGDGSGSSNPVRGAQSLLKFRATIDVTYDIPLYVRVMEERPACVCVRVRVCARLYPATSLCMCARHARKTPPSMCIMQVLWLRVRLRRS